MKSKENKIKERWSITFFRNNEEDRQKSKVWTKTKHLASLLYVRPLVAGGGKESVHSVYRHSGDHSAKIGRPKGGLGRADFVLCGMKVLGYVFG
jgi:hypothetical protein